MTEESQYTQGRMDGLNARSYPNSYGMSKNDEAYVIGFIVGYSESESARQASPEGFFWMAAELVVLYHVSETRFVELAQLNREDSEAFEKALRDEKDRDD